METIINNDIKIFIDRTLLFYRLSANFFMNYDNTADEKNILHKTFIEDIKENLKAYDNEEYLNECFTESVEINNNNNKTFDCDEIYLFKFRNYSYTLKDNTNYFYFNSYPVKNYLMIITNNIHLSLLTNKFIFQFHHLEGFKDNTLNNIEKINLYIEQNREKIKFLFNILDGIIANEKFGMDGIKKSKIVSEEFNSFYIHLLESLKERGLLTFLGIRQTPGSIDSNLPPDMDRLINRFNGLNRIMSNIPDMYEKRIVIVGNFKGRIDLNINDDIHNDSNMDIGKKKKLPSILTVGARALSKHAHRSSEGFWPDNRGKEIEKNIKSEEILQKFLKNCVWINIHGLPHDIPIIELRIIEGYGIRWRIDGVFRGFLEPQMDDGHQKGWRH